MSNFYLATVLPHNIGVMDNLSRKLLSRRGNHAQGKILSFP